MIIEVVSQSTDIESSSPEQSGKQVDECPICNAPAFHKHFGSYQSTCKGCSAFFRRCVVFKKNFKCRRNEKCVAMKGRNKHGCQACRFKNCLKSGMQFDAVTQLGSPFELPECSGDDSTLKKLIQFRNYPFTSRFKALLKVYNGDRSFIGTSGFLKTSETYERAFQAEFDVCADYVKCTRVAESEDSQFLNELSRSFMSTWLAIEVLSRNLRYHSFSQRKAYFTDDSYQLMNEDVMIGYYNSYNRLKYIDCIAVTAMKTLQKVLDSSEKLYHMKITETEFALCLYIFLIKEAKRLHPNPRKLDYLYKNLFNDLAAHYGRTFNDMALCFGNLALAIDLINEVKKSGDELFIMIGLNDVKGSRADKYNLPSVTPVDLN